MARHARRARFRRPAKPPAQIAAPGHDPATPAEDGYSSLLGSTSPRSLPCLNSRLRRLLPRGLETISHRRRSLPPLQNPVFHLLLRRRAADVRRGHHCAIRAAPQGHPCLRLAIRAQEERNEKQSVPGHRPAGSGDESVGAAPWPDDRRGLRRARRGAVPAKGTDEGRGRCKAGSSLDLKLELLVFLSGSKPRNLLASGGAIDPHTDLRFALGAGPAQNHHRIQGLGVQPGDQVYIAGTVFLPKLAYLDLGYAHRGLIQTVE